MAKVGGYYRCFFLPNPVMLLHKYVLTLNQAAILIDVAMQLEVIDDFSGNQ
jgi:hypothetical protein